MATIPPTGEGPAKTTAEVLRIELFIAKLLRAGVFLNFVIVLVGISAVVGSGQSVYQTIQVSDINRILADHENAGALQAQLDRVGRVW